MNEPDGRKGFIEDKQYRSLAVHCKKRFMRTMLALGYTYGFRKAELLSMKVRNVDLLGGTVGINLSKNGEARKVSLTEETRKLFAACIAGKGPDDALIHPHGAFRQPRTRRGYSRNVDAVSATAGCPGLLFHDLRRKCRAE